jgi:hypothetical protein
MFADRLRMSSGIKAIGGTIYTFGLYTCHAFLEDDDFEVLVGDGLTCDVLVVGGGGAGGSRDAGGGGGAGGLVYHSGRSIAQGTHSAVIGDGGPNALGTCGHYNCMGSNGDNTTFHSLTANGGGTGGAHNNLGGQAGGCGGGGSHHATWAGAGASTQSAVGGDSATYGFGTAGGVGYDAGHDPGGGGGAGAVGDPGNGGSDNKAGDGGVGKDYSSVFGTTYGESGYFAGGGGGCQYNGWSIAKGLGGTGGGGDGGYYSGGYTGQESGSANTGGGGGGFGSTGGLLGSGGSGIVIVRYLT